MWLSCLQAQEIRDMGETWRRDMTDWREKGPVEHLSQLPCSLSPSPYGWVKGKRPYLISPLQSGVIWNLSPDIHGCFGVRCRGENIRSDIDTVTRTGWTGGGGGYVCLFHAHYADSRLFVDFCQPSPRRTVVELAIKPVLFTLCRERLSRKMPRVRPDDLRQGVKSDSRKEKSRTDPRTKGSCGKSLWQKHRAPSPI